MREPPEVTPDGRYLVIDGRRWRATDPAIPEARRDELTRLLMAWRREVRRTKGSEEERGARAGVQAAKVALGERGTPWWEQSDEQRRTRWSAEVQAPTTGGDPAGSPDVPKELPHDSGSTGSARQPPRRRGLPPT